MAEETQMTPVEMTPVEPTPSAPPLINPITRKPVVGTATQTGLKPGLKLPPKPAAAGALKPGLKLPAAGGLKPGLKLPARPVIHKPGAAGAAPSLPKPLPKPVTSAAAPAAEAPKPASMPVDAQGVGKPPTVEAKAISRDDATPAASENPKPMEALKTVTQKLKGLTQQIPQQAILRKTGIISENEMSDAQKQAAKSKTARISLSDAMGVAPVKNENAPLKTIRIKRPVNLTETSEPVPAAAPAAEPGDADATVTKRKTLRITRVGSGAVRPTGKFGVKRPENPEPAAAKPVVPAGVKPPTGAAAEVSEIPDIPPLPVLPAVPEKDDNGPAWAWTLSSLVQVAACATMGALAWFLYQNSVTQYF